MKQRTQYLIQIIEKIGIPLIDAAGTHSDANNQDDTEQTAQIVASLLGKVVETSIAMNQTLDLSANDGQDDSIRVALAALAGTLTANHYKQKQKIPEAKDINRLQNALSAMLTFSDNFTISDDHIKRLASLHADGKTEIVDTNQINIQYIDALTPVVNAVGEFSFGQPEQKLIMDVSNRLITRTAQMRETILPDLGGDEQKLAELSILRASAQIYAACHVLETQRLGNDQNENANAGADVLAPVWKAFESRTAMLEATITHLIPGAKGASIDASAGVSAPVAPVAAAPPVTPPAVPPPAAAPEAPPVPPPQEQPPEQPAQTPPPAAPAIFQKPDAQAAPPATPVSPAVEAPEAPTAPPPPVDVPPAAPIEEPAKPAEAPASGNPMAFFGEKPAEETPPPPPAAPPEAAPPVTPPPAAAAETPAQPVPETPPQAQPATDESSEDNKDGDDSQGSSDGASNPMGFFAKKD